MIPAFLELPLPALSSPAFPPFLACFPTPSPATKDLYFHQFIHVFT